MKSLLWFSAMLICTCFNVAVSEDTFSSFATAISAFAAGGWLVATCIDLGEHID